jgi:predicted phosphodiesterase
MSHPNFAGAERLIELWNAPERLTIREISCDPELGRTLLSKQVTERNKYTKTYRTVEQLLKHGIIKPHSVLQGLKFNGSVEPVVEEPVTVRNYINLDASASPARMPGISDRFVERDNGDDLGLPPGKSRADAILEEFEKELGHYRRYAAKPHGDKRGRREYIIASDFHVADDRPDLLIKLVTEHQGKSLIIGGDFFDFSSLSRHPLNGWQDPGLYDCLSRGAAVLDLLASNFVDITLVLGNHDKRAWTKALNNVSTEYGKFNHENFIYMLEHKFGVKVVDHVLTKQNGATCEGLHYWHQVGDCIVSHSEHCGRPVGKGAEGAFEFFRDWTDILGLNPFRVILQAHTHKQSYHRSRNGKVHLYEIGCMCEWQNYSLQGRQVYGPPQHGYYHLVQFDGVTDINASRLVNLDD